MEKVAEFDKVSLHEFLEAYEKNSKHILLEELPEDIYDHIALPCRATSGSAGYDFCSSVSASLSPGQSVTIPTGIKCWVKQGWTLMIFPRSGLGFKYRAVLANTVGIIDSDYYNNAKNEGHIMIKICNDGYHILDINIGDRIAQGIFVPFGITKSDEVTETRNGGFGSTGK